MNLNKSIELLQKSAGKIEELLLEKEDAANEIQELRKANEELSRQLENLQKTAMRNSQLSFGKVSSVKDNHGVNKTPEDKFFNLTMEVRNNF